VADPWTPLVENEAPPEPLTLFQRWYEEAAAVVRLPQAMALATVGRDGRPSSRMVLMTSCDERGFAFDSQLGSRKSRDIEHNHAGSLLFYWDPLGRQVRIEGTVLKTPHQAADRAFAARPRGAQLLAHASLQSLPIDSREALEERVAEVEAAFAGRGIPRPPNWGGFTLNPHTFEFWQHRDDRLHDRLFYERLVVGWRRDRLQP
jgi:pyridoxamine 5'-phosphate oxidase